MNDFNNSDVEIVCRELLNSFQGVLSWKWDRRFETVLAEFGVESKENIRATLERSLSNIWDSSNVGNAPDRVRPIDSHLGGLWPGQLLFTSDLDHEGFGFLHLVAMGRWESDLDPHRPIRQPGLGLRTGRTNTIVQELVRDIVKTHLCVCSGYGCCLRSDCNKPPSDRYDEGRIDLKRCFG